MFKDSFKYYKAKCPPPDLKDVIDFRYMDDRITRLQLNGDFENLQVPLGIQPLNSWKCFTFAQHPGLLAIRNAFTVQGQRYWMARCLRDYPKRPNRVNLSEKIFSRKTLNDWWSELNRCTDYEAKRLKHGLRWSTLGYHHNWDTKIYNEDEHSDFPQDLAKMCNFFAYALGWRNFKSEAAIINYYPIGTTLAGHTDHSELNLEAPLFSFSFGQTAIFLIGGQTVEVKPSAMLLESGDVLIMSQQSRLCYHAVPRVMKAHEEAWNIPINSRDTDPNEKISALQWSMDAVLYQQVIDELHWLPFKKYLYDSRLNINVRQVLREGQCFKS